MSKKMKRDLKYAGFGVLIFALAVGFTYINYRPANAAGPESPLVGFSYALDIQGAVKGFFTEAYNIGSDHELIEQKVVSTKGKEEVRKIPGRFKISDIILKRGITNNMDLWTWRQEVVDGKVNSVRRDGSLIMFDKSLKEVARWNFLRAWPNKLICNPVDASATSPGGGMAIEQVNISVEWIKRVK